MIFNITFGFSGQGVGWGETHAMLSGNDDPASLIPTLTDIANKRAQFLGREFTINAIRASRYSTDGGVRQRGVRLVRTNIKNSVQTAVAAAEPAAVALLVTGTALPSLLLPQFNTNNNKTFCGAPPDDAVNNAGVVDPGKAGLGAAFASWRSAMIQGGLGWLASQTLIQDDIATITQNPDGTVTFVTANTVLPTLTLGTTYRIRVKRVNSGRSPLNGELIAKLTVDKTFKTQEVVGIPTPQIGGSMRVYKPVAPFIGYGDLVLQLLAAKHKRGRPFGSLPGRAKARVRG